MRHPYPIVVRFGDCDPAGIAYFPVIFDWFHQAMEDWFDRGLERPYATVIEGRRLGFPAVHSEADFVAPCRMGDRLTVGLSVAKVGRTSLHLAYTLEGAEAEDRRATGRTVVVVTDLETLRPRPLPEDLAERMAPYRSQPS